MEAEGEALAQDVERDGGGVRGGHGRDAVEQRVPRGRVSVPRVRVSVPRVRVRARARLRLRLRLRLTLRLRAEG